MSLGNIKKKTEVSDQRAAILETVIFQVGSENFGLDIFRIAEITKLMPITKLPRSLPFIEGIINLRGRIIPVVDFRRRLGLPSSELTEKGRIIIVRVEGQRLGLLVDSVTRVVKIPRDTIERVPPSTLQMDADFIDGVGHHGDSLIILIGLDKILSEHEKEQLAEQRKMNRKAKG